MLARKRKLKAGAFRELGEAYEVCPYQLQIDAARLCEVVICDYNYVFAPRSALGRATALAVDQTGKPNLVIDEAHNLPARTMDYYSPRLSCLVLETMRAELQKLPSLFRREALELLDGCVRTVASCGSGKTAAPARIDPPGEPFLEQDAKLRGFMSRYLESDLEIQQKDPVLRLAFYWSEFTQVLEVAAAPGGRERKDHLLRRLRHDRGVLCRIPAGGRLLGHLEAL